MASIFLPDYGAFTRFLDAAAARPFRIGQWDCLHFTDGAQRALHGLGWADDLIAGYLTSRGRMRSRQGLARRFGVATIEAALDRRLTPVAGYPRRGAVALVHGGDAFGIALGVVTGAQAAFLDAPQGLRQLPLAACAGFWDR